jgi:Lectin C-type domain
MRRKLICGAVLLAGAASYARADVEVSGPFSDPYKTGDSLFVVSRDTWTGAEAYAQTLGGNLMSINSAAENTWVVNNILTSIPENLGHGGPGVDGINLDLSEVPVWIGLSDPTGAAHDDAGSGHAANFHWADGSTSTYLNWNTATGEPNDASPGEYYTAINWHYAQNPGNPIGTWNDTPNDGTQGYGGNSNGGEGDFHGYYGIIEVPTAVPLPASGWSGLALMGLLGAAKLLKRRATIA